MILGNVDSVGKIICGWSFNTSNPDDRCVIDIWVNNILKTSFLAGTDLRNDVSESNSNIEPNCGFSFSLESLEIEENSMVELKFNLTGESIPGENPFKFFKTVSKINIIEGKDGFLFYSGDKNEVIKQITGDIEVNDKDIFRCLNNICLQKSAVERSKGRFIFVIAPDKLAIKPEILSDHIVLSKNRAALKLKKLALDIYGIDILYPLQELRLMNESIPVLVRTDSHLSWRGHYEIFLLIIKNLNLKKTVPPNWVRAPAVYDLSLYSGKPIEEYQENPFFGLAEEKEVHQIRSNMTKTRVYINPRASLPLSFTSGQSSCGMLSVFAKEKTRVTVVFSSTIPISFINLFKPDIVINYITERNLYNFENETVYEGSSIDKNLISRAIDLANRMGNDLSNSESGTKPFGRSPADENTGERREGEVKIGASLVADDEAVEASQPRQGAPHDAAVSTEAL